MRAVRGVATLMFAAAISASPFVLLILLAALGESVGVRDPSSAVMSAIVLVTVASASSLTLASSRIFRTETGRRAFSLSVYSCVVVTVISVFALALLAAGNSVRSAVAALLMASAPLFGLFVAERLWGKAQVAEVQ